MTGEFRCQVESYQIEDSRTQYLQMIVPETDFDLSVEKSDFGDSLNVVCSAKNIYPEPQLKILYVTYCYLCLLHLSDQSTYIISFYVCTG